MLNRAPIFVNGFQRGGTNILINLLVSHPDVCLINGETHEVFYGDSTHRLTTWGSRFFHLPVVLAARRHEFWPYRFYPRQRLPQLLLCYLDLVFFWSKLRHRNNRFRDDVTHNSLRDIAQARMLAKNVNGNVLAASIFAEMYPDATFIGLVRHGLALCESLMRRQWSAERVATVYECVCKQMIQDSKCIDNYKIFRFEDLVTNPRASLDLIYAHAGLDSCVMKKVRLQAKATMDTDGIHRHTANTRQDRQINWFDMAHIQDYFRPDVNDIQIAQISDADKAIFLQIAQPSMTYFGYE